MRILQYITTGLLCLSPWVIACSNADFEEVTQVSKPRILDIVEEPVGAAINETWLATPVLAYPNTFQENLTLEYQLCIFDLGPKNYYRCVEELPIPFNNILAEGEGDSFSFEQSVLSNEQLHQICEALSGQGKPEDGPQGALEPLPLCKEGLPVQLRVKMCRDTPGCEDQDAVIVRKRTTLLFEESAQWTDRNTNPVILGITIDHEPWDENQPKSVSLGTEPLELDLNIQADLNESAQYYRPYNADPNSEPIREELETRWFATTEGIESSRRYYREGVTRDDEFKENQITLEPDLLEDGEIVDFWVILRDSRLGSDVIQRQIVIHKQ